MTILTVKQFKELVGDGAVTATDSQISLALSRYEGIILAYVGRDFDSRPRCETFYDSGMRQFQLTHYPVSMITSVTADRESLAVEQFYVHHAAGIFYHEGRLRGRTVTVEYVGGYVEAPHEVKVMLATLTQGFLSGATGGVNTLLAGRKEVVFGVASIDYGSVNPTTQAQHPELGAYTTVLDKYRCPVFA